MSTPNSGTNSHRRRRRFSWTYDEDHHIGQYSDDNTLLPINENYYQFEDGEDTSYDCDECETDQDSGMDLCEPENGDASRQQNPEGTQQPQPSHGIGRRRRRTLRKVLGKGWEAPSPAIMQRRNRFRHIIDDETRRHRRILPNSATGPMTEARPLNVLHLLRNREIFGGGSSNGGLGSTTSRGMGSSNASAPKFTIGAPILAHPDSEDELSTKENKRTRRRKRSRKRNNSDSDEPSLKDEDAATTATSPVWNTYKQRHTTDELRSYAEHACVTKFESSYLSHLQHDEQSQPQAPASNNTNDSSNNDSGAANGASNENANGTSTSNSNSNQNQQNLNSNTNSKAVSTISIAFSPDGKTMASTHGDHTVKITCCMTGKLLQTLVGHPRTPWTVKYHPHAGADLKNPNTKKVIIANRTANTNSILNHTNTSSQDDSSQHLQEYEQQQQIVASGCLGHQVRIWDWVSGTCLQMIRLEFAIISLSFHPEGNVLAVANGTRLHFWALPTVTKAEETNKENTPADNALVDKDRNSATRGNVIARSNGSNNAVNTSQQPRRGGGMHIEMRHMLRCVHFLPDGKRIIVGGVNPPSQADLRRRRRGEKPPSMSFYLRLWDFDLEASMGLPRTTPSTTTAGSTSSTSSSQNNSSRNGTSTTSQHQAILESTQTAAAAAAAATGSSTRRRRPICNVSACARNVNEISPCLFFIFPCKMAQTVFSILICLLLCCIDCYSLAILFQGLSFTMMVDLMSLLTGRHCAHVQNIGCQRA